MKKTSNVQLESREEAAAKRLPPQQRLSAEPPIKKLVAETQRQMDLYEATTLRHLEFLNPTEAIENLRNQIRCASDMDEVSVLQKRVAELLAMPGEAQVKARDLCRTEYDAKVKPALLKLVGTALVVLEDYAVEAHTAEDLLFEQFGIRPEVTAVSRRVAAAVATVTAFRDGFVSNVPTLVHALPPARHPALSWFAGDQD